jgi:predicted ribosomally synthesized peptide with SipW-like signal peptide
MKSNLKRNVVISVLTICLLLLLLTGSTYALFTDSASANIVVGSAKVDVEVEITGLKTYSYVDFEGTGEFVLGGKATLDSTGGVLKLENIAPGDKVEFTLDITNDSNITILERVRFAKSATNPLLANLKVTIAGVEYKFDATGEFVTADGSEVKWEKIPFGAQKDVVVTVELPKEAGNDCQDKSVTLQVIVEAYQGNATADDLKEPAKPRV